MTTSYCLHRNFYSKLKAELKRSLNTLQSQTRYEHSLPLPSPTTPIKQITNSTSPTLRGRGYQERESEPASEYSGKYEDFSCPMPFHVPDGEGLAQKKKRCGRKGVLRKAKSWCCCTIFQRSGKQKQSSHLKSLPWGRPGGPGS